MSNLILDFNCWRAARNTSSSGPKVHVQNASLPEGTRIYAMGDGHGAAKQFNQLRGQIHRDLDQNGQHIDNPVLILLGDNVGKRGNPAAMLEATVQERQQGRLNVVYVHGNHEQWTKDFLNKGPNNYLNDAPWLNQYGGAATLQSYGVRDIRKALNSQEGYARLHRDALQRIPQTHRDLLNSTVAYAALGDFHFTHAGVNPTAKLEIQDIASDLRHETRRFLTYDRLLEKVVVHGHFTRPKPEVRPHRIGIDTGAGSHKGGPLTIVVLEGGAPGAKRRFLQAQP